MTIANATELALVVFFLLAALLLSGLAVLVRRHGIVRGTRWFTGLLVVTVFWAFGAAVKLVAPESVEYVFVLLELPMGMVFAFVFFVFASSYTGRSVHRSRWFAVFTAVVFTSTSLLIVTNPVHRLLWESIGSSTAVFPHLVHVETGPLYFLLVIFAYLFYSVGIYYLIDIQIRSRYTTNSLLLITLGGLSPLLVNVASIVGAVPIPNLDYTPFGLVVFGLATIQSLKQNPFDVVPIARDEAVEHSSEGIIILDSNRCIRDYNPTAERVLPEIATNIGEPFTTVFDGDISLDRAEETHSEHNVGNGAERYVTVTAAPITDELHHLGWTVVISDITDRKQRERHLQLVDRVHRHNISNRMTVILGMTELLESCIDPSGRKHLSTLKMHAEQIVDTSTKLRQIRKILTAESGRTATEVTSPINDAVREISTSPAKAAVSVTCPDELWAYCSVGLQSAVKNLVENGIEHNDADEPHVQVTVTAAEQTVDITVADDGPGLSADEQQMITDKETPLQHSSGVGLWLVSRFVEQSGGELTFGRSESDGTKVTLTLERAPRREH